jgi:predicted ATP-dependent serine protease
MRCPKCGHNVPNAKGKCNYCGAVTDTAESIDIPRMREEQREKDILLRFGLAKTKRKPKINPLVLMLISLGSAILAGALVWFST